MGTSLCFASSETTLGLDRILLYFQWVEYAAQYFSWHARFNGLPPSLISKFPASSLFCAARNKSDFRQIAEASPNPPWIVYLTLYVTTRLCVLSVTRYRVYSADYDPR